jgi:hypothetical protein
VSPPDFLRSVERSAEIDSRNRAKSLGENFCSVDSYTLKVVAVLEGLSNNHALVEMEEGFGSGGIPIPNSPFSRTGKPELAE